MKISHKYQGTTNSSKTEEITYDNGIVSISKVLNPNWLNKEFKENFPEINDSSKIWIENMTVDFEKLSNFNVEFKRKPNIIYILVVFSMVLFSFSYFTNSLFTWNAIVYLALIPFGFLMYLLSGQTIFKFKISSLNDDKSFQLECRTNKKDLDFMAFVNELQKIKETCKSVQKTKKPIDKIEDSNLKLNTTDTLTEEESEDSKLIFESMTSKDIIKQKDFFLLDEQPLYFYENDKVTASDKNDETFSSRCSGNWILEKDIIVVEGIFNEKHPQMESRNGKYKIIKGKNLNEKYLIPESEWNYRRF